MLGYDRDELESMHMDDIHPADVLVPEREYRDTEDVIESELATSDGRTTVSVTRTPVTFSARAILEVARDVTERKAREEELRPARRCTRRSSKMSTTGS